MPVNRGVWEEVIVELDKNIKEIHKKKAENARRKKKGSKEEESRGLDGKVSPHEFERILFSSGISWLSRTEMRERFDMMDDDGSGKLNLLEVQDEATRVLEIVR